MDVGVSKRNTEMPVPGGKIQMSLTTQFNSGVRWKMCYLKAASCGVVSGIFRSCKSYFSAFGPWVPCLPVSLTRFGGSVWH